MAITKRLLAPIAIQDRQNKVTSVDIGAFVRRVLLFETYVLRSIRLDDVVLLNQTFGGSGLAELLKAGALKIHCETYTIGQFGQVRTDLNLTGNTKRLPLCSYSFSPIRLAQHDEELKHWLGKLESSLQEQVEQNLVRMAQDFSARVFEGFYGDLRRDPRVAESAVCLELRKQGIKPRHLKLRIVEIEPEDFRVESNLIAEYGLSKETAHKLMEKSLLAVADLNQRFAEMLSYSVLSGIREADMPLLKGKLEVVGHLVHSANAEQQFERMVTLLDIPEPVLGETKIKADQLLKLRESDECRAFRDWLAGTGNRIAFRRRAQGATPGSQCKNPKRCEQQVG
jgi:hypothetical protein